MISYICAYTIAYETIESDLSGSCCCQSMNPFDDDSYGVSSLSPHEPIAHVVVVDEKKLSETTTSNCDQASHSDGYVESFSNPFDELSTSIQFIPLSNIPRRLSHITIKDGSSFSSLFLPWRKSTISYERSKVSELQVDLEQQGVNNPPDQDNHRKTGRQLTPAELDAIKKRRTVNLEDENSVVRFLLKGRGLY